MRPWTILNLSWLLAPALIAASQPAFAEWLPISPQDLQMTSEPLAPKASSILLYRQVDRDDDIPQERVYLRAKILTEEGRQSANVEIVFNEKWESIGDIEARSIRPDGTVMEFKGTIYDKQLATGRGLDLRAKVFAFPDVQVGSIIEYRYLHRMSAGRVYNSQWILSWPLFTREAHFSLRSNRHFSLRYSWPRGLPPGTNPPTAVHGLIQLEAHNIPAFANEEHAPPDNELKYRVDFIYSSASDVDMDPVKFWKDYAKTRIRFFDDYVDQRRAMTEALQQIIAPNDSSDTKLRKIYARVQQLRNLTFERRKSSQEKDREDESIARDVKDVWRRGAGSDHQIDLLFLALVRAAGFQADTIMVAPRDAYFFRVRDLNPGQLNTNIVLVSDGGKEIYLDPGSAFTQFGMLPWAKTGTRGLLMNKEGGRWVDTPLPAASDSTLAVKADLRLSPSGTLTGRVAITMTGLEAVACRLEERNEDDTHRKQFLENLIKLDVPGGIEVSRTGSNTDWVSSETPFVAEYEVTIPDWATLAGQRALMPVTIFSGRWKQAFEHAARIQPIYFHYPFEYLHDVSIELPQGWSVASLPKTRDFPSNVLEYHSTPDYSGGALHLKREFVSKVTLLETKYYDAVRDFFQNVRTADAEQIVLTVAATARGT